MSNVPAINIRRQRWLEFANFMESLPEEDFTHNKWCATDHKCKTSACVAGWASIKYSDKVKKWLSIELKVQDTAHKLSMLKSEKLRASLFEKMESTIAERDNLYSDFSWEQEGRKSLFLPRKVAVRIFFPNDYYWTVVPVGSTRFFRHRATNKDIALIFRYLATLPSKSLRLHVRFNRELMRKAITATSEKQKV